jgi:hypothetical protein
LVAFQTNEANSYPTSVSSSAKKVGFARDVRQRLRLLDIQDSVADAGHIGLARYGWLREGILVLDRAAARERQHQPELERNRIIRSPHASYHRDWSTVTRGTGL